VKLFNVMMQIEGGAPVMKGVVASDIVAAIQKAQASVVDTSTPPKVVPTTVMSASFAGAVDLT
jgi:hypothetical protein